MIIINLKGGLGNQLFQYALYEKYKYLNKEVYLYDIPVRENGNQHNGIEIDRVFNLRYKSISKEFNIQQYMKEEPQNLYVRLNNVIKTLKGKCHYEYDLSYKNNFYKWDDCFLDGYWQSPKYFQDIRNKLIEELQFWNIEEDLKKNRTNEEILNEIKETNAVCIHIRRGDYYEKENVRIFGNICDLSYYKRAISCILDKEENVKFFFFSDDIEWCSVNFDFIKDKKFVMGNRGELSYIDMYLMSKCKHNIIANSSFSWWGAWLNQNEEKIVIAPKKWMNGACKADIWDNRWIRI